MPHIVDPKLRPLHADVYMALREYWLMTGHGPSKQELSLACCCSNATIVEATRELLKRGWIVNPKFVVRSMKPTDFDLTVARNAPGPWDDLAEERRFWKEDDAA